MIKRAFIYLMMLLAIFPTAKGAETAGQAINRAAQLLKRSTGISADFSMKSPQGSVKGVIKSSGNKFAVLAGTLSTWYDGKTMWTYNARTNETTITLPTPGEVAETNPLSAISTDATSYIAAYSKKQPVKGKSIVLTPKTKSAGIRSVTVVLNTSYQPTSVAVTSSSGQTTTVNISKLDTKSQQPASAFVYPKTKYPKASIVDLR